MLRSHYLLQIEHNVDHAYPVWQALQTLNHGVFPLAGQGTSVLFANPALTGYLFLPTVALTRSPLGAYLLTISLNTLAVFLAYRAARQMLGVYPALVAAGLLAVNPWVIEYSRTSWVQSLLPFFACALAWLLWPVLMGQSRRPFRRTVLALVVLTLYTQTYLLAFLVLAPVALLIVIFRRNIPPRALLVGGGFFVLMSLLYGFGLLRQMDTVETRLGEFSSNTPHLSAEAWGHALRLVTGEDYELARGQDAPVQDAALRHTLTHIAHVVLTAALLVGLVLAILYIVRRLFPSLLTFNFRRLTPPGNWRLAAILLLWFALPILFMSYVGQPVHPFYQLLGLPAGHILVAWGLCAVFRPDTRIGRWVLLALGIPFALLMAVNSSRYYQETTALPGAHGLTALSLEYGLQLGGLINDHLNPGAVVYADIEDWILNSFAGRTFPVIRDVRVSEVQEIPPSGALTVRMEPGPIPELPYAIRRAELNLPDGWTIAVDDYLGGDTPIIDAPANIRSEQGMTFLGYNLRERTNGLELETFWRVDAFNPGIEASLFAPFIHIFNDAGERVQIIDGAVMPGDRWGVGDLFIHRQMFDLPASGAPFTLQIGQYDSTHGQNMIFLPDYTPTITLDSSLSP